MTNGDLVSPPFVRGSIRGRPVADLEEYTMAIATLTGVQRIAAAFSAASADGHAALMPYFTAGFPDLATSEEILVAIAEAGADLIEIGVPFSDPLADGPVIQRSTQIALENGMTAEKCVELVRRLRRRGIEQPIALMGYANPIVAYGVDRYVKDVGASGADGLIVPDLPVEEADELESACAEAGLALIFLAAPTSPAERLGRIATRTTGFLYLVSLTGVTGARESLPGDLAAFVGRARAVAQTPLAVGFGIARPEQAAAVGRLADGVIVGSALIRAVDGAADPARAAREFVADLRAGMAAR
jgi:tryptophan synthase alpha chain